MKRAGDLYDEIKLVCPVDGVVIGDISDKNTWVVSYGSGATANQISAAHAVIDSFDVNGKTLAELAEDSSAAGIAIAKSDIQSASSLPEIKSAIDDLLTLLNI